MCHTCNVDSNVVNQLTQRVDADIQSVQNTPIDGFTVGCFTLNPVVLSCGGFFCL